MNELVPAPKFVAAEVTRRTALFFAGNPPPHVVGYVPSSIRHLLLAFGFVLLSAFGINAQPTNFMVTTNLAVPHSGRYLFVVETSATTRHMAANIQKAAADIVVKDLAKRLHEGDTIGLWTYNDQPYQGEFRLQTWKRDSQFSIATNIVEFLSRQKYEKVPDFNLVIGRLADLIRESEKLTIFIISAGDGPIVGSPFDDSINASYAHNRAALKKQNLPFITLLRSYRGDLIGGSVTWEPWPVDFPEFPPPPKIVEAPKPPPPPPPVPMGKPLILIGTPPASIPASPVESNPPAAQLESTAPAASAPPAQSGSLGQVVSVQSSEPPPPASAPVQPPPQAATVEMPASPAVPAPATPAQPAVTAAPTTPAPTAPAVNEPEAAATPSASAAPVQVSVVVPSTVMRLGLVLVALCLLVLAIILGLYVLHRSRARQASLISSSMDRQK